MERKRTVKDQVTKDVLHLTPGVHGWDYLMIWSNFASAYVCRFVSAINKNKIIISRQSLKLIDLLWLQLQT